jgi:Tfp pilus assembly protein PilO
VSDAKQKKVIVVGAFAVGVLAILVVGYLMLISPKRSKAASLESEAVATQSKLTLALAASHEPGGKTPAGAPDLFRLSKAMPDRVDTAGAILDLSKLAKATGVTIESLLPSEPIAAPTGSYQLASITATFSGTYSQLTNLLGRARKLVVIHHGRIESSGRLFGVDTIQFVPDTPNSSILKATVKFETYIYATAAPVTAPTPTTTDSTTDLAAAGATG